MTQMHFYCFKCKLPVFADKGYLFNGEKYCPRCYRKLFKKEKTK